MVRAYSACRVAAALRAFALAAVLALGLASLSPAHRTFAQEPMQLPADAAKLVIHTAQGAFPIVVEIADKPEERARGLMFRETMAPDHGMLFKFDRAREVQMWMKNTPMSLDMVFIRPDGTVATIAERTEPFSETVIDSGEPVSHVLELRAGTARMIGLKPGDRLEHPSLAPPE